MFEQSLLRGPAKTSRAWSVVASFAGQIAAVGVAVLLPFVFIDKLPMARLAPPLVPPRAAAPRPPHVEVVGVIRTTQVHSGRPFLPSTIPTHAAILKDPPLPPASIDTGPGIRVPYSPGPAGAGDDLLSRIARQSASYRPAPAEPPVPKPAPRTIARLKVGGLVQEAMLIRRVLPAYPQLAQQARISGVVKLHAVIGSDGRICELRLVSGHPLLAPAAMDAVRQWVYRPTLLNGDPVEVETEITVNFSLGG